MDFLALHRYEMYAATSVSPFERWAKRVERLLGHDLDGDQQVDGYSLDDALEAFERGVTALGYVKQVSQDKDRASMEPPTDSDLEATGAER